MKFLIWLPAIFCAFLSMMRLFGPEGATDAAFYSFLPMCFVYAGILQLAMHKRMEILESRLLQEPRHGMDDGAQSGSAS